jgi:Protein of unknown function (DUF1569)
VKSLRNAQDKNEIIARLEKLHPGSQRLWGKMSVHQMVCHLSDGYKVYSGKIPAAPAGSPRRFVKFVALWVPVPWPKGVKTVAEVDQERGGTRPIEFIRDLNELAMLVDQFAKLQSDFRWPDHPIFGRMSYRDYMRLGYLHPDHHLRQFGI